MRTVVIGGGVAGLTCALSLADRGGDVVVLERERTVGGKVSTAHVDGWQVERNREQKILVPAHSDAASRIAAAKSARETLKLTIPIAVDDMNDSIAEAFGAGENSAYVVGRDGKILARQTWADPFGLRRIIDETVARN